MDFDLDAINKKIESEIQRIYEGYEIQFYASGFGCDGIRDAHYDIILKDGSRFVAVALYDVTDNTLRIEEREYVEY